MGWTMDGKTVLITGASNGIGLEAARILAARGARLALVGRDPERTRTAEAAVRQAGGPDAVTSVHLCDFASLAAIRQLATEVSARHRRLDVLVNNAGGVNKRRQLSADGFEMTFAVNHLAPFLLTNLLLPRLRASAPARVVTVASVGHRHGTLDFDDLGYERGGYAILRAYGRSKLANVLFAAELARRLAGSGVTSNSLHPGSVATDIWSGAPLWAKPLILLFLRPFFIGPEKGGERIVQLVADPALDTVSGCYFDRGRAVAPSALARDEVHARRLWEVSSELVGLGTD